MNQKGIQKLIIVVIVVVVLAVVGVAAYWAMSSGGGEDGGGNGVIDGGGNGDETTVDVAGASSLQFSVRVTPAGMDSEEYTYMIKNAGTSSLMMRIEMESSGDNWVYIINGAQEKAWVYSEGEWVDFSDLFPTYWDTWNSAWEGYRTNLLDWTGVGDWSYTTPNGDAVRIYDVTVNPSLADSLFQPS
jgi:hypothetical protein